MKYLIGLYLLAGIVIEAIIVTTMDVLNADVWEDKKFHYSYKEKRIGLAIVMPLMIPIVPIFFIIGFIKELQK